jgi:hypothetical protein
MIVIDSTYYTDGSRPVLFYNAEELIRFGPIVVLDDAWRYRHCVATQRNPGSSEASAWDQARLSGRTSSPTEAASRVASARNPWFAPRLLGRVPNGTAIEVRSAVVLDTRPAGLGPAALGRRELVRTRSTKRPSSPRRFV